MSEEIISQIQQCMSSLISGEDLAETTEWFVQFTTNPESLNIILSIIPQFTTDNHRLFLIIQLQHCIDSTWKQREMDEKIEIFTRILELMRHETALLNRNNILYAIQKAFQPELFDVLIPFIQELSSSSVPNDLEMAIMLMTLLRLDASLCELVFAILDAGASSDNFEVRLSVFYYLLYTPIEDQQVFEALSAKIPQYWEQILEILEPLFNSENYQNVSKYFNFACSSSCRFRVNIIPLLDKALELARNEGEDADKLLALMRIVESIILNYTDDIIESDYVQAIIEVFILASSSLFQPDDTLAISQAHFFEKSFTVLCSKSQEILEYIYSLFDQLETTNNSHFVIVRSFAAMLKCSKEFFLDKLNDIAQVLIGGMDSDSLLLVEASVSATNSYMEIFASEDDELTVQLTSAVLSAATSTPTVDIVNAFSQILELSKQTDELFDETFQGAVDLIASSEVPVLQQAALFCLMALAKFSSLKISVRLPEFTQVMFEILGETDEAADILKPTAVECLHIAANNLGTEFDPYAPTYLEYIVSNLGSEGVELALTCFSALELMAERYPEDFRQVSEEVIQTAVNKASHDPSPIYRKAIVNSIDANEGDGVNIEEEFEPVFQESATALRLLSVLVKIPDFQSTLRTLLLRCCVIQSHSDSVICKSAAAYAISNLADAIASPNEEPPETETTQMGNVLLTIILPPDAMNKINDAAEGFTAAAHVVDVLEYQAFGRDINNFLTLAKDYLVYFLEHKTILPNVTETISAISYFISNVAASARSKASQMLQQFVALTPSLVSSGESELRTVALKFISDIIPVSSESIDDGFKASSMEIALQIAEEDIDKNAFICIRVIAKAEPELAEASAENVYRICMEKLQMPVTKTDRFYLMRDNCLITFGEFAMNVFGDRVDFHDYIIPCLSALPIVMDYEIVEDAVNFFFWLFERGGSEYPEQFLQVMVVLFAVPPHTFSHMGISAVTVSRMKQLCTQLLATFPNQSEIVSSMLDEDEDRIQYFTNAIQEPTE